MNSWLSENEFTPRFELFKTIIKIEIKIASDSKIIKFILYLARIRIGRTPHSELLTVKSSHFLQP